MSSKYGNLLMVFSKLITYITYYLLLILLITYITYYLLLIRFLYYLFVEVIFEASCFELEKSIFEVKHTCTF
jgi:hypothetical protein